MSRQLTSETAGGEKSKGKQGTDKDKKSGGGGGSSKGGKLAGGGKDSSVAAKGAGKVVSCVAFPTISGDTPHVFSPTSLCKKTVPGEAQCAARRKSRRKTCTEC